LNTNLIQGGKLKGGDFLLILGLLFGIIFLAESIGMYFSDKGK
jgi:hypothetical protein